MKVRFQIPANLNAGLESYECSWTKKNHWLRARRFDRGWDRVGAIGSKDKVFSIVDWSNQITEVLTYKLQGDPQVNRVSPQSDPVPRKIEAKSGWTFTSIDMQSICRNYNSNDTGDELETCQY